VVPASPSGDISDLTTSEEVGDYVVTSSDLEEEDQNLEGQLPPYDPPRTMSDMLQLPSGIRESLRKISRVDPHLAFKLKNACHKKLVNWVHVALQVGDAAGGWGGGVSCDA